MLFICAITLTDNYRDICSNVNELFILVECLFLIVYFNAFVDIYIHMYFIVAPTPKSK